MSVLSRRTAISVFLVFAIAYFFSALIRTITATLSPTLTQEFSLNARDLGLLAGGYFLGFAATQLPLGSLLDRHGPKRVILGFLSIAVVGCLAFSMASGFTGLLVARILCGVGVSACLMAPLTGYRRWFDSATLLRANSWMLMAGSMGMVASTLPVHWLMPLVGWRALFWGLASLVALAMLLIQWRVPAWQLALSRAERGGPKDQDAPASYAQVWRHPTFRKMAPIGFFVYGGLLAMQTLWVVPWMTRVAGYTASEAATGFFGLNVGMLVTFWTWGLVNPVLVRKGLTAEKLMARGVPLSFVLLAFIIVGAQNLGNWTAVALGLYCISCTFVSLAQPAVGMAFTPALAGRALSAYNLVIFSGVFVIQWGIGLLIDGFRALGFTGTDAFRAALSIFLLCCIASYGHFLSVKSHNVETLPAAS